MTSQLVCPACLSTDTTKVFEVTASQAAQCFVQRDEFEERHFKLRSHIANLWSGENCQIRDCRACGFGFAWPFIAGDDVFYNLAYPNVAYPKMKWEFGRTLRSVNTNDLAAKRAIEVGAGHGFFLDLLCERGVRPRNVEAIEYNRGSIDHLRQRGYSTISEDIRSSAFDSRMSTFDYIFLFQVVEHMDDLDALFSRLRSLAKVDGSIFIAVPNVAHINYQEANRSLIDMPPNHIGRWTGRAFEAIAARHGLALAEEETEPFDAPLFLGRDLHFSHLRRAQDRPTSLSGVARRMPRGGLRKAIEFLLILSGAPLRVPHWLAAFHQRKRLGQSLWVHLKPA